MSTPVSETVSETEFPTSDVVSGSSAGRPITWSPMWIVTGLCLLLAIGLSWAALDAPGVWLKIRFDRGHGLKIGDGVMYRGIEVGHVGKLTLRPELDGVDVRVLLDREAERIAREGSRFWIVRPQVGVQGISGLETAIGSKYLSVIPGESDKREHSFIGLETPPPEGADRGGIEIVLRGDDRWGVNPGSPLSWRGMEVGQVLGCSLSPDARHVDTRVRIDERYRTLLSPNSKFWVTSGIQMDLGMTGLKMSAESLSTIARGGIAFITPASSDLDETVQPGDVFVLHRKVDDDWIASASGINRFNVAPPSLVRVRASWKERFYGLPRLRDLSAWAIAMSDRDTSASAGAVLMLPSDLVRARDHAIEGSYRFVLSVDEKETPLTIDAATQTNAGVARIAVDSGLVSESLITRKRFRDTREMEDVFAVSSRTGGRRDASSDDRMLITEMIGREQLTVQDEQTWRVLDTALSTEVWNGAAVLSAADEQIVGMLIVGETSTTIARLPMAGI